MKQVRLKGTGQLNGPVVINLTLELEDKVAQSLLGYHRDQVKIALLATHYPGVKIKPNQIGCEIKSIRDEKASNISIPNSRSSSSKSKKSFGVFGIIMFLIFLPFKLAWWLLKFITKK